MSDPVGDVGRREPGPRPPGHGVDNLPRADPWQEEPQGRGESSLRVAITGASGLIGSALAAALERDGHRVHRVVRGPPAAERGDIRWDPDRGALDPAPLDGVHAVVHLAGENVGQRWTVEVKRRIRDSRVRGTSLLASTLARLEHPPRVLVSASAVGYYGDRGDTVLDEAAPPGHDFLAGVAREWEGATDAAREAGIRVVHPRTGIVLSPRGGALPRMLLPFRAGVGGRIGDGRQWMSWLSLADTVGALRYALASEALTGAFNLCAPAPVRNEAFVHVLGVVLNRPALLPVPAFAVRLALGEMAQATVLASQRAIPARLEASGYRFRHPELEGALRFELARPV